MVLSYCVPCHRREADLVVALPVVYAAAALSPPVEVVIVDYANHPPLTLPPPPPGVTLRVPRYTGRDHYHMAHARNLSIRAATGDYVVVSCADILPEPSYFVALRMRIEETRAVGLIPSRLRGVLVCQRAELVAAGGFDERFEFYGPEDKDLEARLRRRGAPGAGYWHGWLRMIPTPDVAKVAHYRVALGKRAMHHRGVQLMQDNKMAGVLVANDGQPWGVGDA